MILYKYLTPEKAIDWLIRRDGILLTPPIYFDDKSEFRVRRSPADEEEVRRSFDDFGGGSCFDEYRERVMSTDFLEGEPAYMREKMSEKSGVVSFCAESLEPKMWKLYAADHSGVAIGYPTVQETTQDGTAQFFAWTPLEWGPLWKVHCDGASARIVIDKDFGNIIAALTRKESVYQFESEWRFIGSLEKAAKHGDDGREYYLLPAYKNKIQRVIFGYNADCAFKHDLCRWLGETDASIEEAFLGENDDLKTRRYSPASR